MPQTNPGPSSNVAKNWSNTRVIQVTDVQIAAPTADLLADEDAVYQSTTGVLYQSSGTALVRLLLGAQSASLAAQNLRMSSAATTAAALLNQATMQAAITSFGDIGIHVPGTYYVAAGTADANVTFLVPSDRRIYLGAGVRLARLSNANQAWFVNSNYAAPRKLVTAITSTNPSTGVLSITYACAGHTFVAGDRVMVVNESTGYYNGIFDVLSVVAAVSFTVYWTGSSGSAPAAGTITRCYACLANANIEISGAGILDNGDAGNLAVALGSIGIGLNKVRNANVNIFPKGNLKFALWASNLVDPKLEFPAGTQTKSDGIHLIGPLMRPVIRGWGGGGSSDDNIILANDDAPDPGSLVARWVWKDSDTIAITSSANNAGKIRVTCAVPHNLITGDYVTCDNVQGNTGLANSGNRSAGYKFVVTVISATVFDCDNSTPDGAEGGTGGTVAFATSQGDIMQAEVHGSNVDRSLSRTMLIWSSRAGLIDVDIYNVSRSNRGATTGSNPTGIAISVPSGPTACTGGTVNIRCHNWRVGASDRPIIDMNGYSSSYGGSVTLPLLNISFNGLRVIGEGLFPSGQLTHVIQLASNTATVCTITTANVSLNDVEVDVDVGASSNTQGVALLHTTEGSRVNFKATDIRMKVTGTTRTACVLRTDTATTNPVVYCQITGLQMWGGGTITPVNAGGTGDHWISGSNFMLSGASGSYAMANLTGPANSRTLWNNINVEGTFLGGINANAAKAMHMGFSNINMPSITLVNPIHASATINLQGFYGGEVQAMFTAGTSQRVVLRGGVFGRNCPIDCDAISAANIGAVMTNSNATPSANSQALGFVAAAGAGMYAYVTKADGTGSAFVRFAVAP